MSRLIDYLSMEINERTWYNPQRYISTQNDVRMVQNMYKDVKIMQNYAKNGHGTQYNIKMNFHANRGSNATSMLDQVNQSHYTYKNVRHPEVLINVVTWQPMHWCRWHDLDVSGTTVERRKSSVRHDINTKTNKVTPKIMTEELKDGSWHQAQTRDPRVSLNNENMVGLNIIKNTLSASVVQKKSS